MNCPWHPNKRVVASCRDCSTEFCIECVRETDQTTLCPDCYRRKLSDIAREFTEPTVQKEEPRAAPVSALPQEKPPVREQPPQEHAPAVKEGDVIPPAAAPPAKGGIGRKRKSGRREKAVSEPADIGQEDFLSQGPDDDFSQFASETTRVGGWSRKAKTETTPAAEASEAPAVEVAETPDVEAAEAPPQGAKAAEKAVAAPSEDSLLQDVMSTLLKPEAEAPGMPAAPAPEMKPAMHVAPTAPIKAETRREKGARSTAAAKAKPPRDKGMKQEEPAKPERGGERSAERWSFLAQPRTSQYTLIAASWWRATIFIVLMLLLGAVLWAVPNAYLIPKDQEYGIHAVLIGFILGIAFWWKAGKKHGTKLAVQAALTTFFALFIGEFLHWFLIITKYSAFRTVFFDLVSFRFLWENGPEILRYTVEAMFPMAFIWLLLLPTLTAFIIGFGMPPIPEIFLQIWYTIKGQTPGEKKASHGLEG